ncbi:hypothetical protein QOZ80_1AG0010220 [Eleusine coracana subsp. coracana]|nr:hypothetical protein QOZ80_1AG0010220 [Eleusine coracana subsp. coracana]
MRAARQGDSRGGAVGRRVSGSGGNIRPFPNLPGVQWKDVVYDATRGLKVRMYMPLSLAITGVGATKLPVLVYFHAGGYCMGGPDQPMFHSCCQRFAAELPAVVLDVLHGHVLRYAARLKEMGKAVELAEFKGQNHGFSIRQCGQASEQLIRILKQFVHQAK